MTAVPADVVARLARPSWIVRVAGGAYVGEILVGPFHVRSTAEWIAEAMRETAAEVGLPAGAVALVEVIAPIDLPAVRALVRRQART